MQMMQESLNRTDALPITAKFVQRAITELRAVYQRAVEEPEWARLARVAHSRTIPNDNRPFREFTSETAPGFEVVLPGWFQDGSIRG
jgi:hypothetical protein